MRKILLAGLLCVAGLFQVHAQEKKENAAVVSLSKVYVLPFTYEYESASGKQDTWFVKAGLAPTYSKYLINDSTSSRFFLINPTVAVGLRHYYNLDRRTQKGHNTQRNSADYVGVFLQYVFPPVYKQSETTIQSQPHFFILAPSWGMQRNYANRLSWNFSISYGLQGNGDMLHFSPAVDFGIGFYFKK